MVIVIDSNVWISALVFGGNPRRIFELVVSNGWRIAVSEEIFTEVRRNLNRKFPEFLEDFEDLTEVLKPFIDKVALGKHSIHRSRDPDDDKIIETAVSGKAAYIITGDKDLLVLQSYEGVKVYTPQQFLQSQ